TGIERLILNLRQQGVEVPATNRPVAYVAHISDPAKSAAADFARELRHRGVPTIVGVGNRPVRARLRNADAAGVRWTALFGGDELKNGTVSLRDMLLNAPETLPTADAVDRIAASVDGARP